MSFACCKIKHVKCAISKCDTGDGLIKFDDNKFWKIFEYFWKFCEILGGKCAISKCDTLDGLIKFDENKFEVLCKNFWIFCEILNIGKCVISKCDTGDGLINFDDKNFENVENVVKNVENCKIGLKNPRFYPKKVCFGSRNNPDRRWK